MTRKMSTSRSQRQMKSEYSEVLYNIHAIKERVEVSFSAFAEPGMGRRCEARLDIFGIQESAARVGLCFIIWPVLGFKQLRSRWLTGLGLQF